MRERSILITNYHPAATAALIRDFVKIGFRVVSPDSDWGRIAYFGANDDLGGELISFDDYMARPPGFVLITCKAQEEDLKRLGRAHGDAFILNIAQQYHTYEDNLSEVMICPDITTYDNYPGHIPYKMLYFPRPIISGAPKKDIEDSFHSRQISSYISKPEMWAEGFLAYREFKACYPGPCAIFGFESEDGPLTHEDCNIKMARSYFTVHFKEEEAYGLSCIESMLIGTPVVSTRKFMGDKTLGRCFLNQTNSILTDTVEEAVKQLCAMDLASYHAMSLAARQTVLDLTSDAETVDRLRVAMNSVP